MWKKIPQSSIEGEEIHFENTEQTHTKEELNPVSMKSQQQNSQGQPRGHGLAHGSYQARSTTTKEVWKASFLRCTYVVGLSCCGG